MKTRPVRHYFLPVCLLFVFGTFQLQGSVSDAAAQASSQPTESTMTLKMIGEDRDVGLKRMEILEKTLSPELLAKKRAYVRSREQEYNEKIGVLLQRLTTPIGRNTVITHIDVDYFAVDFEPPVQAEENINVTILVDNDGLAKWAAGRGSQEAAVAEMQALIQSAFRIPAEQITIVVAPN
ncbi:MAG: hypothetical protein ACWGSD_04375 [Thermodesulfobacteriota bacterium]